MKTRIKLTWIAGLMFFSMGTQANAQPAKKVRPEDYRLWSALVDEQISPGGNWASYRLRYEPAGDTLFLKQTNGSTVFSFAGAHSESFSSNGKWFIANDAHRLGLVDLKTGKIRFIDGTQNALFSPDGKWLGYLNALHEFTVLENGSKIALSVKGISSFSFSPDGKVVACFTKAHSVLLWRPGSTMPPVEICSNDSLAYKNPVWSDDSSTLAFMAAGNNNGHIVYWVNGIKSLPGLRVLDAAQSDILCEKSYIGAPAGDAALRLNPDGTVVFIYVGKSKAPGQAKPITEVWNSKTPFLYPRQDFYNAIEHHPKSAVWKPLENTFRQIATDSLPMTMLTQNGNYAFTYNPQRYEPQYEMEGPVDFLVTAIQSGISRSFPSKQSRVNKLLSAPDGNKVAYFRDRHWWIYDCSNGRTNQVSATIGSDFYDTEFDMGGEPYAYGSPGWSADSNYLLVYDRYDIWRLSADGIAPRRLTRGRERGQRFRLTGRNTPGLFGYGASGMKSGSIDLSQPLLLEITSDDLKSGYSLLYPNGRLTQAVYGDYRYSVAGVAASGNGYLLRQESFVLPPRLLFWRPGLREATTVVQSNRQQQRFRWGQSKIISYNGPQGQLLKGILFYPPEFDSTQKYPMVTHIYEKQSYLFHRYQNPSLYNQDGFNIANFSLDGYFVLLPDIKYKIGEPGQSALRCVESAVKEVVAMGIVDPKRIGLIGASFGGYETAYILSQSRLFAAGVSGAATTDMVGKYLSLDGGTGNSQMWKYESQQLRMGKSLFEDYQGYVKNSVISQVPGITTPLLSWNGKLDHVVSWQQGLALHLAMRRLGKIHQYLVYPGQYHALSDKEAQKDLTSRIKSWFDYHLKE